MKVTRYDEEGEVSTVVDIAPTQEQMSACRQCAQGCALEETVSHNAYDGRKIFIRTHRLSDEEFARHLEFYADARLWVPCVARW